MTTTTALVLALILGVVSGLRVFTAPAAVMLARGGIWGFILTLLALVEYVIDAMPKTPSRTVPMSVVLRLISGAFVGWAIATSHGASGIAGVVVGVIGALIGTYGGHAVRMMAIARIGAIPAAITEDIVAIALAAFAVTR
jgi:uncharacterized membrane protein